MDKQPGKTVDNPIAGYQRESELRSGEDGLTKGGRGDRGENPKPPPEGSSFIDYYEESLSSIQEGSLVKGEIVHVGKICLGRYRLQIGRSNPYLEFMDADGNVTAQVGESVDVILERREDDEGIIILSEEKAAKTRIWDDIREIYEKGY